MLVHPAGSEPSAELREALAKHRIAIQRATSPFDALAQLCRLSRAQGQRPTILLLAHPDRLDKPAELFQAAQRYASKATCWIFDAGSTPRLRAASAADAKTWGASPIANLVAQPDPVGSARTEITFIGPGFPRTPVVADAPLLAPAARPAARVEPKPASPPAPPPTPLKLTAPEAPTKPEESKQNTYKPVRPAAPALPGPKFVGGSWDGGTDPFPGSTPGKTPRQLLTDEELAMLLADGPTRPQS